MKRDTILIFILTIICLFGIRCYFMVFSSMSVNAPSSTIIISDGESNMAIANNLESAGFIRNASAFYLLSRFQGKGSLKAGEYKLSPGMTPIEILEIIRKGRVVSRKITVPEGLTIYQVADLLAERGWAQRDTFLDLCSDPNILRHWDIKGPTVEGYLFPETYLFSRGIPERQILDTMISQFRKIFTHDMVLRAGDLNMTVDQVVTLASLIEKETALSEEKPVVSAVFHNRIKAGIPLQCDPTVIYGLEGFDGNLTKEDLRKKTPYNTYRMRGLPVGPIANPGVDSLNAALYPAQVDYRYFVSKNNGSHVFSETLQEHNRKVYKYQKNGGFKNYETQNRHTKGEPSGFDNKTL